MDFEGRVIRADYDYCSVISLYLPSGTNADRLEYKFKFMDDFKEYIDTLKQAPQASVVGITILSSKLIFTILLEIKTSLDFYPKNANG